MQLALQPIFNRIVSFNLPWESAYGYGQALHVGNVIYVPGGCATASTATSSRLHC